MKGTPDARSSELWGRVVAMLLPKHLSQGAMYDRGPSRACPILTRCRLARCRANNQGKTESANPQRAEAPACLGGPGICDPMDRHLTRSLPWCSPGANLLCPVQV